MQRNISGIDWSVNDGIGHLVLDNQPSNKMNLAFFGELAKTVQNISRNGDCRAVLVYGKGRHFSAGADLDDLTAYLNAGASTERDNRRTYPLMAFKNVETLCALRNLSIPVIAIISGICLGSAFELALNCHVRFCTPNVVLGLPEVTFGLMPGLTGTHVLHQKIGFRGALELCITGNNLNASEAMEWGLIDAVFDKTVIHAKASQFADILHCSGVYDKSSISERLKTFHITS